LRHEYPIKLNYKQHFDLPDTGRDMLQDEEYQSEENQTLHSDANLQDFTQVLHEFTLDLDDFEEADHPCHANHLVKLSYSCESRNAVYAP